MLKYTVLLLALAFTVINCHDNDGSHSIREGCMTELNITSDDLKQLKSAGANLTEPIKCYTKCFYEKIGFLDSSGAFLKEAAINKMSRGNQDKIPMVTEMINKCVPTDVNGETCDAVYLIFTCVAQERKAMHNHPS